MACKPQYKGKRYNSLEELYKANGVNIQQAQQLYGSYLQTTNNPTIEGFKQWNSRQQQVSELFESNPKLANAVYEALGFVPKMISREGQEYFNNSRIRFFVKIADEVRAVLPDVKEGYTRLYRGNRPSDLKSNPQFTNSLEGIALPFLMSYEGQLSYIDVPTPDLSKYVQRGGVATNAEFIVTSEIAKSATPIDNTIVEKYKEQYPDKLAPVEITPQQKQKAQQLYSQYLEQNPDGSIEQFKNWVNRNNINKPLFSLSTNNIKSGVTELFESNSELANEVYEALGFGKSLSLDDILKEYSIKELKQGVTLRSLQNKIEEKDFETIKRAYNYLKSEEKYRRIKNSNEQIESKLEKLREKLRQSKETKVGSVLTITNDDNNSDYKVKVIEIHKHNDYAILKVKTAKNKEYTIRVESDGSTKTGSIEDFVFKATNTTDTETIKLEIKNLKSQLQKLKSDYSDYYIDYFENDNQITHQQKQEAQQLYSQYLESLNNPNANPILQGNQQEQVKKFTELQERLNNKEFLEGAKNAYESSEGLQEWGTQEEYNDYIARVSLGIIKNPSSGEYNYTSQVKDIVYHGTSELFETFDKLKQVSPGFYFTPNSKSAYFGRNDIIYAVILNVKNPISNYKEITEIAEQGTLDAFIEKNYDGIVELQEKEEIIVFEPEQIHILGSKQDIEGFKAFVESNNTKTNNSELTESEIKPIVNTENKTIKNNYEIFKEVQDFFDSNLSTMDNVYNAIFNNSEITPDDIIKQIIKTDNVEKECNGGVSDSNWEIV